MADRVEHATTPNKPAGTPNAPERKVETEKVTVEVPKDMDPGRKAFLLAQLKGPVETVVGNFADLQRAGAAVVSDGKKADEGFMAPPESHPKEAESMEDVAAPGPAGVTAKAAEEATGFSTAQGERPSK